MLLSLASAGSPPEGFILLQEPESRETQVGARECGRGGTSEVMRLKQAADRASVMQRSQGLFSGVIGVTVNRGR